MESLQKIYKVLGVWSMLSLLVFSLIGEWGLVLYVVLFVGMFGFGVFKYRQSIGETLVRFGFTNHWLFSLLVVSIVLFE